MLSFTEYGTDNILFKEKDSKDIPGNYSYVNSSMKAIYGTVDLLWSVKINKNFSFEYGAGFGLGILFGDLVILNCDQDAYAYLVAFDRKTGSDRWKTDRENKVRSYWNADPCAGGYPARRYGNPADVVPINILKPIPGTPFEKVPPLPPLEILKTIACFRLILPRQEIMIAGGRTVNLRDMQSMVFSAGASALMVGNYLTTLNQPVEKDLQMLKLIL